MVASSLLSEKRTYFPFTHTQWRFYGERDRAKEDENIFEDVFQHQSIQILSLDLSRKLRNLEILPGNSKNLEL